MILVYYTYILENVRFIGQHIDIYQITALDHYSETTSAYAVQTSTGFPSRVTGNGLAVRRKLNKASYTILHRYGSLVEPKIRVSIYNKCKLRSHYVFKQTFKDQKLFRSHTIRTILGSGSVHFKLLVLKKVYLLQSIRNYANRKLKIKVESNEIPYVLHPYFINFEQKLLNDKWTFIGAPVFNPYIHLFKEKNYGLRLYTSKQIKLDRRNRRIYKNARRQMKLLKFKQPYSVFQTLANLTAIKDEDDLITIDGLLVDSVDLNDKRIRDIDPQYKVFLNPIKRRSSRRWLHPEYREERIWTQPYLFLKKKPKLPYQGFAAINLLKKTSADVRRRLKYTRNKQPSRYSRKFRRVRLLKLNNSLKISKSRKKQPLRRNNKTISLDLLEQNKSNHLLSSYNIANCTNFYAFNKVRTKMKKRNRKTVLRAKRIKLKTTFRLVIRSCKVDRIIRLNRLLVSTYLNPYFTSMQETLFWKNAPRFSFMKTWLNLGLLSNLSKVNENTVQKAVLFNNKITQFKTALVTHVFNSNVAKISAIGYIKRRQDNIRNKKPSKKLVKKKTIRLRAASRMSIKPHLREITVKNFIRKSSISLFTNIRKRIRFSTYTSRNRASRLANIKKQNRKSAYFHLKLEKKLLKITKLRVTNLKKKTYDKRLNSILRSNIAINLKQKLLNPKMRNVKTLTKKFNSTIAKFSQADLAAMRRKTGAKRFNKTKKIKLGLRTKRNETKYSNATVNSKFFNQYNFFYDKKKRSLTFKSFTNNLRRFRKILQKKWLNSCNTYKTPNLLPLVFSNGGISKRLKASLVGSSKISLKLFKTKYLSTLRRIQALNITNAINLKKNILNFRVYSYFKNSKSNYIKRLYINDGANFEIFKWQLNNYWNSRHVYFKTMGGVNTVASINSNPFNTFYTKPFFLRRSRVVKNYSKFFARVNQYYKHVSSSILNYPRMLSYYSKFSTTLLDYVKNSKLAVQSSTSKTQWPSFKYFIKNIITTLISKDTLFKNRITLQRSRPHFRTNNRLSFVLGTYGFYYKLIWDKKTLFRETQVRKQWVRQYSFVNSVIVKKYILRKLTKAKHYYINTTLLRKKLTTPGFNFYYTSQALLFNNYSTEPLNVDNFTQPLLKPFTNTTSILKPEPDRVARIRFKPGYSTLWRRARREFKILFFLKFRYQHRFTTYVYKSESPRLDTKTARVAFNNCQLFLLLMKTKFATDPFWSLELLNSQSVFINGLVTDNPDTYLIKGDFLQLMVHIKYYMITKWQKNLTILKKSRIYKLAYRKFKPKTHRLGADRNYRYPDWLLNLRFFESDVPSFVELDFFTLSFLVIKNPFQYSHQLNFKEVFEFPRVMRLYNWKYIT